MIICQDADDIPHRQRIEIIKDVYQKTHFNFLLHLCLKYREAYYPSIEKASKAYNSFDFSLNQDDIISFSSSFELSSRSSKAYPLFMKNAPFKNSVMTIHWGNCAFRREVFNSVQYGSRHTGQDLLFGLQVIKSFNNKVFLNLPLLYYLRVRTTEEYRKKVGKSKKITSKHDEGRYEKVDSF